MRGSGNIGRDWIIKSPPAKVRTMGFILVAMRRLGGVGKAGNEEISFSL